jgi:hypothetical protein
MNFRCFGEYVACLDFYHQRSGDLSIEMRVASSLVIKGIEYRERGSPLLNRIPRNRPGSVFTKGTADRRKSARRDYDGQAGPPGHPDLKGFGANGRIFFWLRAGMAAPGAVHVGLVAVSEAMVNAAHAEALAAGATEIHPPAPQPHYDPRYYAAQVKDPDGYGLEFVFKSWQHGS